MRSIVCITLEQGKELGVEHIRKTIKNVCKHGVVILVISGVVLNKLQHVESIVVVHIGVCVCGGSCGRLS